jgi:hypothetical protein
LLLEFTRHLPAEKTLKKIFERVIRMVLTVLMLTTEGLAFFTNFEKELGPGGAVVEAGCWAEAEFRPQVTTAAARKQTVNRIGPGIDNCI